MRTLTLEHRQKLSEAKRRNPPKNLFQKGVPRPDMVGDKNPARRPEVAKKISLGKTGKSRPDIAGEKNKWWRGGITPINHRIRASLVYKKWRRSVFERDDYTCQLCGIRGSTIHADHIKSFSRYPDIRFDTDNGRTLCVPCHKLTPNYLHKSKWNQK